MSTISASTTTTTAYKVTADTTGKLVLQTGSGPTDAVTIDGSQNVGIGTSSPATKLNLGSGVVRLQGGSTPYSEIYCGSGGSLFLSADGGNAGSNNMLFSVGATERMRIDSSGNLLVGTTSAINSAILTVQTSTANNIGFLRNTNAAPYGLRVNYSTATPNGTDNWFFYADDATQARFYVRSNGGIANFSANNVNLSDERTKTDIQNAGDYLAKICAIPVRTFKYKDQTDDLLNLGVIAQEVETVAPELVDVSGFGETPEDGVPLKAIYQTDLQYALMKCIQEQQALITQLTQRIETLEAK